MLLSRVIVSGSDQAYLDSTTLNYHSSNRQALGALDTTILENPRE